MPIKTGDTVSVHYVGTFNDGTEFDRSREGSPLKFKVGSGMVIPGFDKVLFFIIILLHITQITIHLV